MFCKYYCSFCMSFPPFLLLNFTGLINKVERWQKLGKEVGGGGGGLVPGNQKMSAS